MFLCGCGQKFKRVAGFFGHRDSGECPKNPPEGSSAFVTWSLGIGHDTITGPKTEEERVRLEEKKQKERERLAALKADPVVQERVRQKRAREKEMRRRNRSFSSSRC